MDIKKDFIQRLRGRAEFCRDRGEVKTPELLEQAAQLLEEKAQAVPEGYVLMPKEPTPKMIDATWDFDDEIREMSHNTRNEFIYKTMIEALEPTND